MKWEQPSPRCDQWLNARSIFGDSAEEARKHVFYASNQGVYTLFFALGGLIGAILACVSHGEGTLFVVDNTLAIFATASMLCAALVLFITSKEHHSAVIKQGMFPLLRWSAT